MWDGQVTYGRSTNHVMVIEWKYHENNWNMNINNINFRGRPFLDNFDQSNMEKNKFFHAWVRYHILHQTKKHRWL